MQIVIKTEIVFPQTQFLSAIYIKKKKTSESKKHL